MPEVHPWPRVPDRPTRRPPHGRYLGPLRALPWPVPRMRLKHWHFTSVMGDRHFVAVGLVQLGYVAQAFVYVVELPAGRRRTYEALSPLGRSLHMAEAPAHGTSRWRRGRAQVVVRAVQGAWAYECDVPLEDARLQGTLHVPWGDGLSLLHPLGRGRSAYTYKVADVPVTAALALGGQGLRLGAARGTSDWTYSHAARDTRWRWASACGSSRAGRSLGLNLSSDVYDLDGVSQENVLWVDGAPRALGPVSLSPPGDPAREPWSLRGDGTELRFVPRTARTDRLNLGLVASHFVQAQGDFEGRVGGHELARMGGLMEDHRARW